MHYSSYGVSFLVILTFCVLVVVIIRAIGKRKAESKSIFTACAGSMGTCIHRNSCFRYRKYKENPYQWASHRQCYTKEYPFYLSEPCKELRNGKLTQPK